MHTRLIFTFVLDRNHQVALVATSAVKIKSSRARVVLKMMQVLQVSSYLSYVRLLRLRLIIQTNLKL